MRLALHHAHAAVAPTAAALFVVSAPEAMAQDGSETPFSVHAHVELVSDYRDRGVSYSHGEPAIQGSVILAHESGFYVGVWSSSMDDGGSGFGSLELDYLAGWAGEVSSGVIADISLGYYTFPDAIDAPGFKTSSFEAAASATFQIGPAETTLGYFYAWDQKAIGGIDNHHLYAAASVPIAKTPLSLGARVGYTDGAYSSDPDRTNFDWTLSVSAEVLSPLVASVRYTGVSGPTVRNYSDDTIVLSMAAAF